MVKSEKIASYPELDLLEFDEDFIRIDAAICEYDSVGNAPQRKGEGAFQWVSIENACLGLLKKAKDIRVAIWYIRACMARRGLSGLADGVKLLASIMSAPADEIHPRALPGESPSEIHALQLGWIAGPQFAHQFADARFEGRDVTLAALANGETATILGDRNCQEKAHNVLQNIKNSLLNISESMRVSGQPFDISRVLNLLDRALSRLGASSPGVGSTVCAVPLAPVGETGHGPPSEIGVVLKTRQEVEIALERVAEYFRIHEPSHPAPIFLSRIQRMLGAGFEDVMAELYPEGAALAAQLGRPAGSVK
ncbi:ImpA family type VI secretion system protein [Burkholderia seminalis]|uniref:type VI secretion system protein TssA n=1 Tax=Burkholderia seminalis TaxID=488731 RepID=UPI0026560906|nr:type VI secretion system ImpA family N-terminal domain-containing protein [Burkholderia seminalis]MDN7592079.1 type VI secretion system ImpA family N-terminal domain-containing protein [Burkholderia seminalis]